MNIQVGLSCTTLNRRQLEVEGLGADNLVLGRGAFGTVVLGKWYGAKVKQPNAGEQVIQKIANFGLTSPVIKVAVKVMESEATARRKKSLESEVSAPTYYRP